MKLSFVEPTEKNGKKIVAVSYKEVEAEVKRWENALVGYVLGPNDNPQFMAMKRFVDSQWKKFLNVKFSLVEPGVFVFSFETSEIKELVLDQGPWFFNTSPLFLRPWTPDVCLSKKELKSVPIWIKLPNLKLHLWSPQVLSKIASMIGKPLYTDKSTATRSRLSHARVCVELTIDSQIPDSVTIELENGYSCCQNIEYEKLPSYCLGCEEFGHSNKFCPIKRKKEIKELYSQ